MADKNTEIKKLKKIADFLQNKEGMVEIELYTTERYEVEEYYVVTIGENYVGINRTGFYDTSYWSLHLDSKTFSERVNDSIEKDDFNILIEDYIREEGDITEAKFVNSGSGNYEIQDEVDDYDFEEIPKNILDEETEEIDIEKFQDIYGDDYEIRDSEDYCGKIDSFSVYVDKEKVEINVDILE
tara:strand:+ start:357 stop:908 length:552 start_codon:yes stop_codon:yes gene_type:complete